VLKDEPYGGNLRLKIGEARGCSPRRATVEVGGYRFVDSRES
jgi:hypothetical protein